MKDILFEYDNGRVECEINGLELTYGVINISLRGAGLYV